MNPCNEFFDFFNFHKNENYPIKVCFDIGARDCNESLAFYNTYNCKIYSFEPNPLQKNICLKAIEETDISFFDVALSDQEGYLDFYITHDNMGAASLLRPKEIPHVPGTYNVSLTKVNTYSLDKFVKNNNLKQPDLIWMDVQGNELNVLKGSIETLKNVKYICSEVGVVSYYDNHTLEPEINNLLLSLNFEIVFEKLEWSKEKFIIYRNKML